MQAGPTGQWYPPVRSTLLLLSKLYRCIDTKIFAGLAQEAVAACTACVQVAIVYAYGRAFCLTNGLLSTAMLGCAGENAILAGVLSPSLAAVLLRVFMPCLVCLAWMLELL